MKKFDFNPSVLSAGVALALGIGIATGVSASTTSGSATATTGVQITNTATASYSVDGVAQPTVTSNAVIVNINETGSFSLVATQGSSATDDMNENVALTAPAGSVTFNNTLTNTGNVKDIYTIISYSFSSLRNCTIYTNFRNCSNRGCLYCSNDSNIYYYKS